MLEDIPMFEIYTYIYAEVSSIYAELSAESSCINAEIFQNYLQNLSKLFT